MALRSTCILAMLACLLTACDAPVTQPNNSPTSTAVTFTPSLVRSTATRTATPVPTTAQTANLLPPSATVPPTATAPPTVTPTPPPIERLHELGTYSLLANAPALKVLRVVTLTRDDVKLPAGMVLGTSDAGEQVITVAQDREGNTVFLWMAAPAYIKRSIGGRWRTGQPQNTDGMPLPYYPLADMDTYAYFIPVLSRMSWTGVYFYQRTWGSDEPMLKWRNGGEGTWMGGVPSLAVEPVTGIWYYVWRDKLGQKHQMDPFYLVDPHKVLRIEPLLGVMRFDTVPVDLWMWGDKPWASARAVPKKLRPYQMVNSVTPVKHLLQTPDNPGGLLGIDTSYMQSMSYTGTIQTSNTVRVIGVAASGFRVEGGELLFDMALPSNKGGTRAKARIRTMPGSTPAGYAVITVSGGSMHMEPVPELKIAQYLTVGAEVGLYIVTNTNYYTVTADGNEQALDPQAAASAIQTLCADSSYTPFRPSDCEELLQSYYDNGTQNTEAALAIVNGADLTGLTLYASALVTNGPLPGAQ